MKLEKCPICSTRMREQDGRMVCQNCGYYQIIDRDAASIPTNPSSSPWQQPAGPPFHPAQPSISHTDTLPNQRGITVSASPHNNSVRPAAIIGWIVFAITFVLMVALVFVLRDSGEETVSTTLEETEDETYDTPAVESMLPQSESFQTLVSQIFDKDFSEITQADLNQITELDFYYDDDNRKCISCYLDDESSLDYFLNEALYMDMADLSCFKNVSWLSLEYGYLNPGDLKGMDSLTSIASDMTLDELYEAVPDPQNIEYIQIYSTIFMDSCDGIERFPNLAHFSADCMDMQDISALSSLPELKSVVLTDCDRVTDFSSLYDLSQLQFLAIESSSLKDIGFVKNMPELYHFSISDADELMSIESLSSCSDSLMELYLEDTWKLDDFSVIENLTNLTELELTLSYENSLPSFANLSNLQYLAVYGAVDLSRIGDAQNLYYLSLDNCNCEDLSFMENLQELAYLDLYDMSGYYVNLEPVTKLPGLLGLDISRSTVYTDVASLLSIPTLEEFYMEDCHIGFSPEALTLNENLAVLNMNEVSLSRLSASGNLQGEEMSLSEHTDMFANFPNLQQLFLKGNELENLSFITEYNLTGLEFLDITDNYVVDLTPLADLPALKFVLCEDNPIADTAGLDDILIR